jgi:hypothetical protein
MGEFFASRKSDAANEFSTLDCGAFGFLAKNGTVQ